MTETTTKPDEYLPFNLPEEETDDKELRLLLLHKMKGLSGIEDLSQADFFFYEVSHDGKQRGCVKEKTRAGELAIQAFTRRRRPGYDLEEEIAELMQWAEDRILDEHGAWLLRQRIAERVCKEAKKHDHGMRKNLCDTDVP